MFTRVSTLTVLSCDNELSSMPECGIVISKIKKGLLKEQEGIFCLFLVLFLKCYKWEQLVEVL